MDGNLLWTEADKSVTVSGGNGVFATTRELVAKVREMLGKP